MYRFRYYNDWDFRPTDPNTVRYFRRACNVRISTAKESLLRIATDLTINKASRQHIQRTELLLKRLQSTMRLLLPFICSSHFTTWGACWQYDWPDRWGQYWPSELDTSREDGCISSHLTAFEVEKTRKPVFFGTDPFQDPESPKMLPLNTTGGEQWEFDGVSSDGMSMFYFGFYRDPNYSILGTGNLRLVSEWAFADGKKFVRVDYASHSIVESCTWGTRGLWKGNNGEDYSCAFEITKDMSVARVGCDMNDLTGSIVFKSLLPPRYPDGTVYPNAMANTEVIPYFRWMEPIPASITEVDVQIEGTPFRFHGVGGHERIWTAFSWFTCLHAFSAIRVLAGPHALSHIAWESNVEKGLYKPSIVLAKDGEQIFAATRDSPSDTENFVIMTKEYGGKITGTLRDKATGITLNIVSPSMDKEWKFVIEHKNVGFEYNAGDGIGSNGFSATVVGGVVGEEQYSGTAFVELLEFPANSVLLKGNYVDAVQQKLEL